MFIGPNAKVKNKETQSPSNRNSKQAQEERIVYTLGTNCKQQTGGSKAQVQMMRECLVGERRADWMECMCQDWWLFELLLDVGCSQIRDLDQQLQTLSNLSSVNMSKIYLFIGG